jgi:small-conductance mechanosensitive channel
MQFFNSVEQAIFFLIIIGIGLYLINRVLGALLNRTEKIPIGRKNKILFIIRICSLLAFIYILIDELPLYTAIPPEYAAIITGSVSTALAFITSGIFSNYIAGLLIWIIDPFDIGDIVEIQEQKGVIKSITLTRVILETFNRVTFEVSNSELVTSKILNYSIRLKRRKNFIRFKRKIRSPQEQGNARLDIDIFDEKLRIHDEEEMHQFFQKFVDEGLNVVHTYTFKMQVPYEHFRITVAEFKKICLKYKEIFGIRPRFHVMDYSNEISVKFRILTDNSDNILNYQAQMAEELYQIILKK